MIRGSFGPALGRRATGPGGGSGCPGAAAGAPGAQGTAGGAFAGPGAGAADGGGTTAAAGGRGGAILVVLLLGLGPVMVVALLWQGHSPVATAPGLPWLPPWPGPFVFSLSHFSLSFIN